MDKAYASNYPDLPSPEFLGNPVGKRQGSATGESPESKNPRIDSKTIPSCLANLRSSIDKLSISSNDKKGWVSFMNILTLTLTSACDIIEEQRSDLENQRTEIAILKEKISSHSSSIDSTSKSVKENLSATLSFKDTISSIKKNEQIRALSSDFEICHNSIKISNFPAENLKNCENPLSKIRQSLENRGHEIKNAMHDVKISPLININTSNAQTLPVLLSCKNSSSKETLEKALKKEDPKLNIFYHYPSQIHKQLKLIREKFTTATFSINSVDFDLTDSWVMIRPTADFKKIKILYKSKNSNESWTFLSTVALPTPNSNLEDFSWGLIKWHNKQNV